MGTIEELNYHYNQIITSEDLLVDCRKNILSIISDSGMDYSQKIVSIAGNLKKVTSSVDSNSFTVLQKVILLFDQYINCSKKIDKYQKSMLTSTDNNAIAKSINSLAKEQEKLESIKKDYTSQHGGTLCSYNDFISVSTSCLDDILKDIRKEKSDVKNQARNILGLNASIELSGNTSTFGKELPENFIIGRYSSGNEVSKLMKDIKVNKVYQNIGLNLRDNGNVFIKTDYASIGSNFIDEFVIAYIFKFIESFPIGAVNVHIFDKNADYRYMTLNNIFHNENAGETTKKVINLHESYGDIESFKSICNDIYKKLSNKSDLFSLYQQDHSEAFSLIVIRDGLLASGFGSYDLLETINHLSKPNDIGHKCGLRFLIIDDSFSRRREVNDSNAFIIESIEKNSELILNYKPNNFYDNDKEIELLKIADNIDFFIQNRSNSIAEQTNNKDKSYISLMDIASDESNNRPGSIINIPIGKTGEKTVEIPLSCKDDNGTIAGQCIGYMVIGQSGSGKSSFFHNVVLGGCLKYSPEDLQYWLLDFKNGGASSKYRNSGIPHIKIIAENNKVDDAFCLFKMILEEMERRNKAFNDSFTDNIIDYNVKAINDDNLEYFPRIIIAIDEIQEIFRDDSASEIQTLISSISTRMRSAGMHFVMVAQNLSEGKSYMLKDSFLPSASGRVCFRAAQNIPGDSGFNESFTKRKEEISKLNTGEAYVSYGGDTIEKVKMSLVTADEIGNYYFKKIIAKYPSYKNYKPLVIGSKRKLNIFDSCQSTAVMYSEILKKSNYRNGFNDVVIGEDVYRMLPMRIRFSQYDCSSLFILGSDRIMSSSICTSIALSLVSQKESIHMFNGDKTPMANDDGKFDHPFMYICNNITNYNTNYKNYKLAQFKDVVRNLYSEMLSREQQQQMADDSIEFKNEFLLVNDLLGIPCFTNNEMIENNDVSTSDVNISEKYSVFSGDIFGGGDLFADNAYNTSTTDSNFRINIQNAFETLVEKGFKYNIHVIASIKRSSSDWYPRTAFQLGRLLLFNENDYASDLENSYYVKEMLKNISNNGIDETLAVWFSKKSLSKIRPIIYDISNNRDKQLIDSVMSNGGN